MSTRSVKLSVEDWQMVIDALNYSFGDEADSIMRKIKANIKKQVERHSGAGKE